jgi:hypothetical protein
MLWCADAEEAHLTHSVFLGGCASFFATLRLCMREVHNSSDKEHNHGDI